MDCPQCGGTLATYALSGREASVCEDCGYVGIAAEHRGDPRRIESWNDALRRFYGSDEDPSVELRPPLSRPSGDGPGGESWDDALRRFYDRRTGKSDETESDADASNDHESEGGDASTPRSRPSQSSAGDS
jgi:DNA-directed RNA polymerase subunit M/transcription elongation factor TFIIS